MKKTFVLISLGFLSTLSLIQHASASNLKLLYPLYNYPAWYSPNSYIWNDIAAASKAIRITTIINPDNGPGSISSPNEDYRYGLTELAKSNVKMIGYVATNYGNRDIDDVKADVLKYSRDFNTNDYKVTGIFFDEASVSSDWQPLNYYRELYQFVKNSIDTSALDFVVFNHGTNIPEVYLSLADVNIIYEDSFKNWEKYKPNSHVANNIADGLGALVYAAMNETDMQVAMDLVLDRNIEYAFITDDSLPNPWDELPSYWNQEVAYISQVTVPIPSAIHFLVTGLMMIVFKNLFKIVTNRCQLCADGERRNRSLHGVNEDFEYHPSTNGSGVIDLEQVLKRQLHNSKCYRAYYFENSLLFCITMT